MSDEIEKAWQALVEEAGYGKSDIEEYVNVGAFKQSALAYAEASGYGPPGFVASQEEVIRELETEKAELVERVARLESELARYSMSAGLADQYRQEALAARAALGFDPESESVAPVDLTETAGKLRERVHRLEDALRGLVAEFAEAEVSLSVSKALDRAHAVLSGTLAGPTRAELVEALRRLVDAKHGLVWLDAEERARAVLAKCEGEV